MVQRKSNGFADVIIRVTLMIRDDGRAPQLRIHLPHGPRYSFSRMCTLSQDAVVCYQSWKEHLLEEFGGETHTDQNVQAPKPRFVGSLSDLLALEAIYMRLSNLMDINE
jgi:hypothetical protein